MPAEPLAAVNGELLTHADLYAALQDQVGIEVAERLLIETLIQQEARRLQLVPSAEEIEARVRQIVVERFGGNTTRFAAWMLETGGTEASVRRRVAIELMDLKLRTREVKVTPEALQQYFAANRTQRYDLPEQVRYRQVVVETKERAEEVLRQIKAGELIFYTAASRHSLDPAAAETGGLVGPQPLPMLEELAKPLFEVLAKLQANEYTQTPVAFEGRWYLLLMVERLPGRVVEFADVSERVRWDFLNEQAVPEEDFYLALTKKARVTGLPDRYRVLEERFGAPGPAEAVPVQPSAGRGEPEG
ncbi:MAG: peptidyl-prolyl cis-trans isomerase [Armatimonadetes bacterium]|nr:peptidyl-prolyl cis-trans isomerase [Armatimonadota bacterium]